MQIRPQVRTYIKSKTKTLANSLRFIDDDFFRIAMPGKIVIVRDFLRILLGDPTLELRSMELQKDFHFPDKYRNIIVDVFCESEKDESIIIELQKQDASSDPPRAIFEGHAASFASLQSGKKFSELNPMYVIFLTDVDVFGAGEFIHWDKMPYIAPEIAANVKPKIKPLFHTIYMNCNYLPNVEKLSIQQDKKLKTLEKRKAKAVRQKTKEKIDGEIKIVQEGISEKASKLNGTLRKTVR